MYDKLAQTYSISIWTSMYAEDAIHAMQYFPKD